MSAIAVSHHRSVPAAVAAAGTEATRRQRSGLGLERRGADQRGAAVVEFALVVTPLCILLFGIIAFGVMLSFRQVMTQAAAEGARAAAAAPVTQTVDLREPRAQAATASALSGWSKPCNAGNGMTCTWVIADCGTAAGNPPSGVECMTVQLTYDYEDHPLIPNLPLLSKVLPKTLTTRSVVEVNSAS